MPKYITKNGDPRATIVTLEFLEKKRISLFSRNSNVMIFAAGSRILAIYFGMRVFFQVEHFCAGNPFPRVIFAVRKTCCRVLCPSRRKCLGHGNDEQWYGRLKTVCGIGKQRLQLISCVGGFDMVRDELGKFTWSGRCSGVICGRIGRGS